MAEEVEEEAEYDSGYGSKGCWGNVGSSPPIDALERHFRDLKLAELLRKK